MKILHVIQAWSLSFGGTSTVIHGLTKAQSEGGLEVHVITTNLDTPSGELLDVPVNRPIETNGANVRFFPISNGALLYSGGIRSFLKHHCRDFDLIHVHGLYRFPMTYAAFQARKQRVPYVITPHGALDPYLYQRSTKGSVLLKRIYEWLFEMRSLHRASAIHYTAEEERQRAAFLNIQAPSFVVPNGLDWEMFRTLPPRGNFRKRLGLSKEPMLLFVGRIHFVKGLDILVDAFARVRKILPNAKLVIVGPDNDGYGREVQERVHRLDLQGEVIFTGALSGHELLQAYVDADVFVLTSYTENFGMTVVEAMACRTPVVISDQVNIYREVQSSGAGFVTQCDAGEVAAAIGKILTVSQEERLRMGESGRMFVEEQFTWPVVVQRLSEEYERVTQGAKSCA
ncbi:MAG: glycosyltransferase [Nitrospirae bacterium]|nr:MAG: glycosyltransferase [Nitrospirota bacterium]